MTNIPPVLDGKVFIESDTLTDYHYGLFATVDAATGEELWHVGTIPLAQGGTQAISGNTIYCPGGDGALWALDVNIGQVKWGYHAGFNVRGHTALCAAPAVDEGRGWVIGVADTGHMFVLNKNTGRVVKEAFLGVDSWKVFDPHPDSGYWLPGSSGIAIAPRDGLLYVAGTDYDHAWLGSRFNRSKEKLFCYDYVSNPNTLVKVWEYQFCTNDNCSSPGNQLIIDGHGPYVVAWYSLPSPALADGHVYFTSTNGKMYCFGSPFEKDSDSDGIPDYLDNCPNKSNPAQEDTYPPGGNGCGNACECEGNFDGDADLDGTDAVTFKKDFGRGGISNPCTNTNPCNGDFNCSGGVDGTDAKVFKVDFGRGMVNPCPNCTTVPWCSY